MNKGYHQFEVAFDFIGDVPEKIAVWDRDQKGSLRR
jgi:hypothetical protein